MTQRILPNIVSGGMCCYSQFARTLCFQSHKKTIYIFKNQMFITIKIRIYADIDQ